MTRHIIGLIPAAGHATRLGQQHLSKEVLPVVMLPQPSNTTTKTQQAPAYAPVSHYLLRHFQAAGVDKSVMVLRTGKWDIPERLALTKAVDDGVAISYVVCEGTPSTVHTIDLAYPWTKDSVVAFGFPDIIVHADNVYQQLIEQLDASNSSVCLALFPCQQPEKFDMLEVDDDGTVQRFHIKNPDCKLSNTWACAVWTPQFTKFLHKHLNRITSDTSLDKTHAMSELYVGNIIQLAINAGLKISSVAFPTGRLLDIGTPADLRIAQNHALLEEFLQIHP